MSGPKCSVPLLFLYAIQVPCDPVPLINVPATADGEVDLVGRLAVDSSGGDPATAIRRQALPFKAPRLKRDASFAIPRLLRQVRRYVSRHDMDAPRLNVDR